MTMACSRVSPVRRLSAIEISTVSQMPWVMAAAA